MTMPAIWPPLRPPPLDPPLTDAVGLSTPGTGATPPELIPLAACWASAALGKPTTPTEEARLRLKQFSHAGVTGVMTVPGGRNAAKFAKNVFQFAWVMQMSQTIVIVKSVGDAVVGPVVVMVTVVMGLVEAAVIVVGAVVFEGPSGMMVEVLATC